MMRTMMNLCLTLFLLAVDISHSYPVVDDQQTAYCPQCLEDVKMQKKSSDLFLSRSWGAGGMPFNVLYTQPKWRQQSNDILVFTTKYDRDPPPKEPIRLIRQDIQTIPKMTNNNNQQPRRQYSVLPQLFVSYGWGPIGK